MAPFVRSLAILLKSRCRISCRCYLVRTDSSLACFHLISSCSTSAVRKTICDKSQSKCLKLILLTFSPPTSKSSGQLHVKNTRHHDTGFIFLHYNLLLEHCYYCQHYSGTSWYGLSTVLRSLPRWWDSSSPYTSIFAMLASWHYQRFFFHICGSVSLSRSSLGSHIPGWFCMWL